MTQVFGSFLLLLGGGCSCGEGADCRAGAGPVFGGVFLFYLQIIRIIKILNSIKTKIA